MPYSSAYSAWTVSRGSLPGLRARTKPAPSSRASAGAEQEAARLGADDELDVQLPRELREPRDRGVQRLGRGEDAA